VAGAVTGVDMGTARFLTASEGGRRPDPGHGERDADALADASRALKAFPGRKGDNRSAGRRRAVEKVAKLHRKVRRRRADRAHKTALAPVRSYDVIAHERLRIANTVRAPKAKPDPENAGAFPPNGAAAKAGLDESIHDAGRGVFPGILAHKAESAGRAVIPVDPRDTSRTCPACGQVSGENRTAQEKFECTQCGHTADADQVGALNVAVRAGLVHPDAA
jgi:putative transposase